LGAWASSNNVEYYSAADRGHFVNRTTPVTYGGVFDRLERDHVRYVVVGGIAVVLHGYIRPVADLDIVVDAAPDEARRAMRALTLAGFVPSIPLPLSAVTVLRMFDPAQREVDVFVRYCIPFDELWASSERVRVRVGAGIARVASLEHLLRAKRFNGRPHDLLDIAGLLALEVPDRDRITDASVDAGERDEPLEGAV
jgi:hypothetical protein